MNPWAAPPGPAHGAPTPHDAMYGPVDPNPFGAYSGPQQPYPQQWGGPNVPPPVLHVAPQRSSRAGLLISVGLLVLVVAIGAVMLWFVRKDDLKFGSGVATTSTTAVTTTTTTTKPKPFAEVGDCVLLAGGSFNPKFEKTPCAENRHNYTVSKTPATSTEECGTPPDGYVKYSKGSSVNVCLIPVFVDGECYDFTLASLQSEFPKKACGGYMVVKAKVIAGTADKAACGQDERLALALAYPEIKTTYCLTHTFSI
ncbi:hypothetical protein SAMN04488564_108269 [Lentzea waywayandensis]|uniref:Uncharacterized protein n=1 Tax=Lentzea waywayandensis TaxID=84724 RepID=A0A1I6F5H8_9PSEU|nr:hypothetical protein SAMN04488564_108269 [Lentzea waywayandensis]